MTQSELKDQTIDYIKNNLNNQTALEVAQKIIDDLSIELYHDGYISELIDPQSRKEVLYNLTTTILEDIKKEYNQTTKKDDGFYNVQAHSLEDEYSIYKDFYDKIY